MTEEIDSKVFISFQSRRFFFMNDIIKVLFPICVLTWRVKNYVSRQGEGINNRNESTKYNNYFVQLLFCYGKNTFAVKLEIYFPSQRGEQLFVEKYLINAVCTTVEFFPQCYGNLEKKEKVSSGFERNTRKLKEQSVTKRIQSEDG